MDPESNSEGVELMELMAEGVLSILMGKKEGDGSGEIFHVGYRSQAVLDYGASNEQAWNDISHFKVGSHPKFDHFPLEIYLQASLTRETTAEFAWLPNLSERNKIINLESLEASGADNMATWAEIANCMRAANRWNK